VGGEGRVRLELGKEAILKDDPTDGDAELCLRVSRGRVVDGEEEERDVRLGRKSGRR